ncbi:MAG: AarF/UbiB family protein [Patescibacteria group bacterium]
MFLKRLFQAIGIIFFLLFKRHINGPLRIKIFFETMGGAFLRLGQVLALRRDFLPPKYCLELLSISNKEEPLTFSEMSRVFAEEKGVLPDNFFEKFNNNPFAITSSAQIYEAILKTGERVAVKIQKPHAEKIFTNDYKAMFFIAFILDFFRIFSRVYLQEIILEFISWSKNELDFTTEAQNAYIISKHNKEHPRTIVPKQYLDLSTRRVLIQEFIADGILASDYLKNKTEIIDSNKISYYLVLDLMRQYLIDGFFHADPHPANLIFFPDGKLAYLDFGIVGKSLSPRGSYIKMLYGFSEKNIDLITENIFSFSDVLAGEWLADFLSRTKKDKVRFSAISEKIKKLIADDFKKDISLILEKGNANFFLKTKSIGEKYNIYLPREMILHLRTLTALNFIAMEINPDFDMMKVLKYFFQEYPPEKIEAMVLEGSHEENQDKIIGIYEKVDWPSFREMLALEKERRDAAKEKFYETLEYYLEKYKDLGSSIKKLK